MEKTYERGSEWRKWDLHIHSKYSNLNNRFAESEEIYIDRIIKSDINVIGLTNYFNFKEDDFVLKTKLEEKGIVVFLNLELRLTYQNRENDCCDIHIIFNKDLEKEKIIRFLNNLDVSINSTEKKSNLLNTTNDFQKGVIEFEKLLSTLNESSLGIKGEYLIGFLSRGKGNARSSSVYEKIINKSNFIIHSTDRQENINNDRIFWLERRKPLIQSSDAHTLEQIGSKYTWIKADPTFEGLKQIIYEPEERIKIQETNPDFNFDKSPFTEIVIDNNVDIFNDEEDNVTFQRCTIPLNNNLVSIIGGRGTGKSILIDYIASGLGKATKHTYTNDWDVVIKRKVSLRDEEQIFYLTKNPSIPFMYISQSEIKSIVEDTRQFTKNIRETIGVTEEYNISFDYKEKSENYISEYFGVIEILEAYDTTAIEKKEHLDKEIKRYEDFIVNITSKENKTKLENYKSKIDTLEWIKVLYENLCKQRDTIIQFEQAMNISLGEINEKLEESKLRIPLIDNKYTIEYIRLQVTPAIENFIQRIQSEINEIKRTFAGYSGDLTTLLDNVNVYQKRIFDLRQEKKIIEDSENKHSHIKQIYFKELGELIQSSITEYTNKIENQWNKFKAGYANYTDDKKELLSAILDADNLDVKVDISFDSNKMYKLLSEELDRRSYSIDKLKSILKIDSLENYYRFIKQEDKDVNLFSASIRYDLRRELLELFYKKYTEFISHSIIVSSNGKNITKLSHGQQGTIYLRIKLAANLFSETIIYDQPEDDLDNDFIMSDLVSIFKKIKKYRQVIIVSHNANLVVNADSEQVIIANNKDGILSYISGSLENPLINEQICKILEGGKSAFLNREQKYQFST
jgi:ABC-type lipoprotein export system ATPase subunit